MRGRTGAARSYRIGVDVGGTFTDLTLADANSLVGVGKVLTTPDEPARGVVAVVERALEEHGVAPEQVAAVVHGSTLVANAIIERRGARTALITSEGFRDSLEIGDERRYDLYDLMLERPRPLVPRYLRFEVPERTLADGTVDRELDTEAVERLGVELARRGIEAVAVVFLHSYVNPASERAVRDVLSAAAPGLRVGLSSDVAPEIGEYRRTSTTVASVYVQAQVEQYLDDLERRLGTIGLAATLYLMLSHGGMATVSTAKRLPIALLESGPAGGVLAAAALAARHGRADVLSFDMGGTTAKACVIVGGRPLVAREFEVDRSYRLKPGSGLPLRTPVVDMIEVGVGGGSIARVDSLGLLACGPDSAGSEPGPACYGRGGEDATLTDANLVLGYIGARSFLGGRMPLDLERARRAIHERVAGPLGLSVEEAAWGIHLSATEEMSNAARVHAIERGRDPSTLALYAFGGAGPIHAVGIARRIGAPLVVVPHAAGVMSSAGFLTAPVALDSVRSARAVVDELDPRSVEAIFAEMEDAASEVLVASGISLADVVHTRVADMHYAGQGFETRVAVPRQAQSWPQALQSAFSGEYRRLYGREGPDVPVEVASWRVRSRGPIPHTGLKPRAQDRAAQARKGSRPACFGSFVETTVYDGEALRPGASFDGPAIVEQPEATVVIPQAASCRVGGDRSLAIEVEGAGQAAS